jgi:hypothetical protein
MVWNVAINMVSPLNRPKELQHFARWPPSTTFRRRHASRRPKCFQGRAFESEIAGRVSVRRGHVNVTELVPYSHEIGARLKERSGARMSQQVGPNFGRDARVILMNCGRVASENVINAVSRKSMTSKALKDWLFGIERLVVRYRLDSRGRLWPQRTDPLSAPLTAEVNRGTGQQVLAVYAGRLADPRASVEEK